MGVGGSPGGMRAVCSIREQCQVVLVGEDDPSGGTAWAGGTVPRGNRVRCSTGAPLEGRKGHLGRFQGEASTLCNGR